MSLSCAESFLVSGFAQGAIKGTVGQISCCILINKLNFSCMISALTAKSPWKQENTIQKDARQHVEIAIDSAMDFHAQLRKDNVRFLVPTATLHSKMSTVSTTTS